MPLNEQQIERYSRNIILKQVGDAGQEKLLSSKVLIAGTGGLGSPAALYLAASGIGTIGIADADKVELTNLQRQIIHHTNDIGREKVLSAEKRIKALNPDVKVNVYNLRLKPENIRPIIRDYDFVIDATDNFPSKFLINDACYFESIPFSHAGILEFYGQLITVLPNQTTCYRCIFREPPPVGLAPSCTPAGPLGVVPAVVGSLQATEAIKYLLDLGDLLTDRILSYNALTMEFRSVQLVRNPDCPICGKNPQIKELEVQ